MSRLERNSRFRDRTCEAIRPSVVLVRASSPPRVGPRQLVRAVRDLGFPCPNSARYAAARAVSIPSVVRAAIMATLVASLASATEAEGGAYAGAFLRMGVGARATAVGGAFSSVDDGAGSVYWNPALVPWSQGTMLSFSHWFLGLDRSLSYVGYVQSLPQGGGLGLAWVGAVTSNVEGRDSDGRPTEIYRDQRHAFFFTFGFRPHRALSVGLSVKPYYRRVAEQTASGAGFDVGVIVRPLKDVSVAVVGHELGITKPEGKAAGAYWSWNTRDYWAGAASGTPREISRSDRFLKRLRVGLSLRLDQLIQTSFVRFRARETRLFLDVEKVEMFGAEVLAGLEAHLTEGLILRIGRGPQGLVAGVGVSERLPQAGMRIDYAVAQMPLTDTYTHQLSLSLCR